MEQHNMERRDIVEIRLPNMIASVYRDMDDREPSDKPEFVVWWTDTVANEWHESFDRLSVALLRVATLAYLAETGFVRGFYDDAREIGEIGPNVLRALTA